MNKRRLGSIWPITLDIIEVFKKHDCEPADALVATVLAGFFACEFDGRDYEDFAEVTIRLVPLFEKDFGELLRGVRKFGPSAIYKGFNS
jgi:hypothetical protein